MGSPLQAPLRQRLKRRTHLRVLQRLPSLLNLPWLRGSAVRVAAIAAGQTGESSGLGDPEDAMPHPGRPFMIQAGHAMTAKPMTVALAGCRVRLCDRDQEVGHACAQSPGGMRGVCRSDTLSAGHSVMVKTRDHTVAVTCHLEPTENLYHLSKLLAGLCGLARQGRIALHFTTVADTSLQSSAEGLLSVCVTHDGTTTQVVFDLYDRSDLFETALLDTGALYFKRSFYSPEIRSLPASSQRKILPFGLNYGCRGSLDESQLLESSVAPPSLANYRNFLSFHDFERPPHSPVKPAIVFQTRAWAPDSTSD